jgi:translocation and assembly module TamB
VLRALKIAGWVVASVLSFLVGCVLVLVLAVQTQWGGDKLLHLILPQVNAGLAGRITAKHLRLSWTGIAVEGATLWGPDGKTVMQAQRVAVRLSPWQLVHRRLVLREIKVQQPRLFFVQAEDGETNLQRALASRKKRAERPAEKRSSQGKPWSVDVASLQVVDGSLDVRLPGQGATAHWRVGNLEVGAKGSFDGRFAVQADVRGASVAPLPASLALGLTSQGMLTREGLIVEGKGEVRWGESELRFTGEVSQPGSAKVRIERLRVEPALFQLFAPNLIATVVADGSLGWDGKSSELSADLNADVSGARMELSVAARPVPLLVRRLALRVHSLDLARVLREGPVSQLQLSLDAHGSGHDLDTLSGSAHLGMPAGKLGGYSFGPIQVRVEAERGKIQVPELMAALPGIVVTGSGQASHERVSFHGQIDVIDLAKAVAAITAEAQGPKARASGKGRIAVDVDGSLRSPALRLRGAMAGLTWQELDLRELRLALDVPNLRKPLASDLSVSARQAAYGTRHLEDVKADYRASGRRFLAKVSVRPFATSILDLGGTWNRGHTAVTLNRGQFRLQRARWDLVGPAVLAYGKDTWRVSGLDLHGPGEQRLRLEAAHKGDNLHADLWLSQVQLAVLPAEILPTPLKPAGQLDAEIHARGQLSDPVVDAQVSLAHAEIDGLADVSFMSRAHLLDRRVSGDVQVEAGGAHVSGRFNLPAAWPPPPASQLSLNLTVLDVDLSLAADRLARAHVNVPDLRGLACLKVLAQGTGAHPDVMVDLRLRELQVADASLGNMVVQLAAHDGQPITGHLTINPIGRQTGAGHLSVQAGLALNQLIRSSGRAHKFETVPLRLEAHLEHIALAPVMALVGDGRKWSGEAALDAQWEGTARGGQGKVHLKGQGITLDRYPPTDVAVDVDSRERQQQAQVSFSRRGAPLLAFDVGVQAALLDLQSPKAWPHLPVRVHAALGPLDLRRDGLAADSYRDPSRVLRAHLQAVADVTGTLGMPRLQAHARVNDIRMDDKALGTADLAVSYADGKVSGNLEMVTAEGGRWRSDALVVADLGYPAVLQGLGDAPLEAHLRANRFDVSGFSGLTPNLRTVAGRLTAVLDVTGTLSDPQPSGRLEWSEGEVVLIGMGAYRKIHLLLQGDREFLSLDELKLESGSGRARITGGGKHRAQGGYDMAAQIRVDKLPLYSEGQLLATLSLDAKATSQVTAQQAQAQVNVSSARVVLSEAKRKQLQELARPEDEVLVENGTPVNAEQKRKLAKVNAKLGLTHESAVAATKHRGPKAVIAVVAQRDVWITGDDANLELSLRPGFRIEIGEETQIFGTVEIQRGFVSLLGQRFDMKEGSTVVFGGPPDKPELDVTTTYNDWEDNILVEISAKGQADKLQIGIRAPERPDLTESQLYTLVVTGHLTVGGSTSSASSRGDQAASLLGGVVAGQLQKVLAKKLPIDVLTIQTGSTLGTARVEAGTYVTRRLYVGYVSRLGPTDPALLQNRNAVRLEYDLTSRWSFQGEYGDAMNGNADLLWTKHY